MKRLALVILTVGLGCAGATPATAPQGPAADEHDESEHHRPDSKHEAKHRQGKHQHGPDSYTKHAHRGHGRHEHGDGEYRPHRMPHRFQGAEDWAKRFDNPERDAWQKPDVVIERMNIEPGMTVADIGAGTGYFLPHLSKAVGPKGSVLGLDVENDMVKYMSERAKREGLENVATKKIPPDDPGFLPNRVDRVLIVNTWHHIGQRKAYAAKLEQSLRTGGLVVIVDFHPHSKKGPPKKNKLAPSIVSAELKSAGLEVELVLDALPEQYIAIGHVRR